MTRRRPTNDRIIPFELIPNAFQGWDSKMLSAPSIVNIPLSSSLSQHNVIQSRSSMRPLEHLGQEVAQTLRRPCEVRQMLQMSTRLRATYYDKLQSSTACMLPSFCHALPTGHEEGTFVALDVGGSTFRVALVQLSKRFNKQGPVKIKRISVNSINEETRKLPSAKFFDWMASKIHMMLKEESDLAWSSDEVVPLGLAWSFPIEQTSNRGGKVQGMGKGFYGHDDSIGRDLGELIESACQRAGFRVRLDAIINDSSATLLSQAYINPATSMGLIMGTGTNAGVFLPVSCMGQEKFGVRDPSWYKKASKVITNTELSMFGKNILPESRWDEILNKMSPRPDFQPLEYMTTGRYLGEILRLVVIEAVETCGLWDGRLPETLREQYTIDTALLAKIEDDRSMNLSISAEKVKQAFGLSTPPSGYEMAFLRAVVEAISQRAAAYLAVAIHALWTVQKETEINLTTPMGTPKTSIACDGSVILKYPGMKSRCEDYIEKMVSMSSGGGIFRTEKVVLEPAIEAAIVGAAVAVAMSDGT